MPRRPTTIPQQPTAAGALQPGRPPAFAREQMGTRAENATQENARAAMVQSSSSPFADGNLITGVSFSIGAITTIKHGLGRAFRGFFLVNPQAGSAGSAYVVNEPASDARLNKFQISLGSGGTFVADVWVY